MAPAPAAIPKSPDVGTPVPGQPADKVIPFPAAPVQETAPSQEPAAPTESSAAPAQPAAAITKPEESQQPTVSAPGAETAPAVQAPKAPADNTPTVPSAPSSTEASKAEQDKENSYETKIVLRGDRLRKYFPDVSMTPLAIENSIYDALEERRQRQVKDKAKAEIFKGKKEPVK